MANQLFHLRYFPIYRSAPVRSLFVCTTKRRFWSAPAWIPIRRQQGSIPFKTHRPRVLKLKKVRRNSIVKVETCLLRKLAHDRIRTRSRPIVFKHLPDDLAASSSTHPGSPRRHIQGRGIVLNLFVHVCVR